jgi:GNAT superfamily N-acetyltransferase
MIELRRVETEADADVFLALRSEIDPEHMMARAAYLEHVRSPTRLDLLGLLDGAPVGTGFVEPHSDDLGGKGPEAWISVRVVRSHRRRGVGTELFRALSARARADGRTALTMSVRHDDLDAQTYLGKRGFVEVLRMRDSVLDLADVASAFDPPVGVDLVPFSSELDSAVYAAALEIVRDIPAADRVEIGTFDDWRAHDLSPQVLRDCSFVALSRGEIIGYATLHAGEDGEGLHAMTGVVRAWRHRGVALALKRAQIDAARRRGLRRLRTGNAIENPMLKVNERLGYRRDVDWLHLRGPLLDRKR